MVKIQRSHFRISCLLFLNLEKDLGVYVPKFFLYGALKETIQLLFCNEN